MLPEHGADENLVRPHSPISSRLGIFSSQRKMSIARILFVRPYYAFFITRGQSAIKYPVGQTFLSAKVACIPPADRNVCPTVV